MASTLSVPKEGKIALYVRTGSSKAGNPITSSRTFANIRNSATDDDVYAIATALSQLIKYELADISRIKISDLVGQE